MNILSFPAIASEVSRAVSSQSRITFVDEILSVIAVELRVIDVIR